MKKIFGMLVVLFGLLYIYQFAFLKISKGHNIKYDINDNNYKIKIKEIYRSNLENDNNNYSMIFDVYDDIFELSVYEDFKGNSKIVKDAKYFIDNEYSCLFVKFEGDKILSDVMCKKDNIYLPFNNISNPSDNLIDFISSLSREGYMIRDFMENEDESYTLGNFIVHKSNFITNHFLSISMENELYRIAMNKKNEVVETQKFISLKPVVEKYINNFYVAANYNYNSNGAQIIDAINIYNVLNGEKTKIKLDNYLSLDSYFIGKSGESVYLYDPEQHIEYEINTIDKTILEVGNKETSIKIFIDGEWKRITYDDFELGNYKFDESYKSDIELNGYDKIYKVGKEYGFYYLLKNINNGFEVYRTPVANTDIKTYIFNTSDPNSLQFIQNGIYYKKNDKIMYYSDKTGNRTIISSNDLLNKPFSFKFIMN